MHRLFSISIFLCAVLLAAPVPAGDVDFDAKIRPLLASRCLKCHGPSEPEAGLNLTDPQSALAPLESGNQAIIPGDMDGSELLRRVMADDDERMPPVGERLTTAEVELLRQWISAGAPWPRHWAYRSLQEPAVPPAATPELAQWCKTPIDAFIAQKLVDRGLTPSPAAERRVLLRRLYFDLLGLPPTEQQLNDFLNDTRPDAYERVVDQLLASPHYGERWARHWMDIVHFAETHGHDQDRPRPNAWPYRDYLIRSFNRDTPYSKFICDQVAGDVLSPDDPWAIVATGFLAAGPWDESSLRDIREDSLDREVGRYLDRDDIITTVMSTVVSTSTHCARCHNHKFDPILQEEYYSLQAVFAATDKANRTYDLDPHITAQRRELEDWQQRIATMLADQDPALLNSPWENQRRDWEAVARQTAIAWEPFKLIEAKSGGGAALMEQEDGSILASGPAPDKDTYSLVVQTKLATLTALRLELLPHDSLPMKGPGRQDNGNLHLNELRVFALDAPQGQVWKPLKLVHPQADFNQTDWTVEMAVDGNPNTAWGIHPAIGQRHQATFELAEPLVGSAEGIMLRFELQQIHGARHLIGCFRLTATDKPTPLAPDVLNSDDIARLLAIPVDQRTKAQELELAAHFLRQQITGQLAQLPPPQIVYCGTNQFTPDGSFRPASIPRPVHVLARGLVTQPLAEAKPAALSCIDGLSGSLPISDANSGGERRAALARWLTDPQNALTWRSIANRLWQYHFAQGLVDTPNDFGQMGSTPTHPELLDWLAVRLRDNGGSLKQLHRLMVTSAVYRQASQHRAECTVVDADNRLLWRMNRTRLDAESYRDALLVITGTLDSTMGGPSVRQFIESPGIHVTPNVDYLGFDVNHPANYRRSVYRFIFRTLPDPFMDALDCPDASQLTPKRNVSVTPLQAMATLHDKFVVRQSERLAERLEQSAADRGEQVRRAYHTILGREPAADELTAVCQYAARHGLANACRFLLNTNEFMFVD